MPILYIDSASFDYLQVTSSFIVSSSVAINIGSNTSAFTGSFSGSFQGNGSTLTNIVVPMFKETTTSATLSNTITNTIMSQSLIPANTFAAGDVVEIRARATRPIGTGSFTTRIYLNTSITLSGATVVGTYQSTNIFNQFCRTLVIRTPTNSEVYLATATTAGTDDLSNTGTTITNISNNWAVDQYMLFALQHGTTFNSGSLSFFKIFKL